MILEIGISKCKDGEPYRIIGFAIDKHCKKNGYLPIQYLLGHGIGNHIIFIVLFIYYIELNYIYSRRESTYVHFKHVYF